MPHFRDLGYMDSMTRNIMSPDRRLRQLKLHKSKTTDVNVGLNYFVASKEMQIMETSTIKIERLEAKKTVIKTDIRPSVGFLTATQEMNRRPNSSCYTATLQREANRTEEVTCSRERTEYPTGCRTQMYVPPRPPKHHGG
uniref:Uncharacterized protein n=1 Tax=Pinctada fucata TaxID=50426 RepID=A0A194ANI1_PINFU